MAKRFLLLGIALFALLLLPNGVGAHANLVESNPAANSVVAQPPTTSRLRFTEPLEPTYSRVVLNKSDGTSVSTEPSRVAPDDPYVLLINLPELPEGVYALQWRTLSEVDGHTAQGIVPFAIGDPAAANAPLVLPPTPPDPLAVPSAIDVALRWLSVLSLALIVGALLFSLFLWLPTYIEDEIVFTEAQERFRRLALAAAVLAVVTTIGVLIRAGITAESNILSFAVGSRIGLILSLRLVLTGVVVALLLTTIMHRELSALIAGAGALLTISLLSHSAVPQTANSASIRPFTTALSIFFDFVHLLATATWIGALPALFVGLLVLRKAESGQRGRATTLLVARFTSFATAAIILLAATGTFAALQRMAAISELWTTTYGRALAIKLVLFGLLGLVGAFIRWRVHPRSLATSAYSDAMLRTLRRSVTTEIALSVLLILAVGVLTASAPGRDAAIQNSDFADTVRVGEVTLSLQVARGDLGDIYAVTARGLPLDVEPEVVVRASMPSHMAGEQELGLQKVEAGRWGARGSLLTMPGEWSVETIVRAIGMNDVRHTFIVDTTPVTEQTTSTTTAPIGLFAFVIACLVVGLSQLPFRKAWQYRFQLSGIMLLMIAFFASVTPYYIARATEQTNPLSATPDVLAAGQTVYQQNCVTCHGVGGRGDGPAARSLPGLPADFTDPHFATHTDGQVFGWIRDGKPATAMPAFGERLDEDQIWQVITYIRQLYADAQGG